MYPQQMTHTLSISIASSLSEAAMVLHTLTMASELSSRYSLSRKNMASIRKRMMMIKPPEASLIQEDSEM